MNETVNRTMAEKAERERNMAPSMFRRARCVKLGDLLYELACPEDQSCIVLTPAREGEWLVEEPLRSLLDALPLVRWRETSHALARAMREVTPVACDARHECHFAVSPKGRVFSLCRLGAMHRELAGIRRVGLVLLQGGRGLLVCEAVRGIGILAQRTDARVPEGAVPLW